jgi:hypothetical protein|tara:strand:+ start:325 stop:564 length:240 start_codon:yes stop_codon:yes gene_type:complete
MDEDTLIMMEVQTDMMDLLAKYPKATDQAIAMCFKLILDCYVATLGEENAANLLETAVESIKSGNHSLIPTKIPKNLLN